jgi:ATP-dependent protease ClpP protease subunit
MLKILKSNISENTIYQSWIKETHKVFSNFSDDDFFSDKVQHIYFYSEVNDDSVNNLQSILMEASKTTLNSSGIHISPKPICLHLNSPGGSLQSTDIFYTLIQSQRVPLCVVIENLSASAATDIALLAPYRLMIDYSSYLIHDGFGVLFSKVSNIVKSNYQAINSIIYYQKLLKKRTKLSDKEIKNFLDRDIIIDAKYCLDKGIIDRILKFPKINNPDYYSNFSNLQLNLSNFLKKTNLNHIYISDEIYNTNPIIINGKYSSNSIISINKSLFELSILLDNLFLIKKDNIKTIILHFKPSTIISANPLELIQLNYRLAMIQKRIPIIAFIEGQQSFDKVATILMCPVRIMMKPSIFQSQFSFRYSGSQGWGFKTIDIIDNSLYIFNTVVKLYKEISNLPDSFYKRMRHTIINLNETDLLKYNIIHLCLNIHKEKITLNDIVKYLNLNKITGFNNKN